MDAMLAINRVTQLGSAPELADGLPTPLKYAENTIVHHPANPLNCTSEKETKPSEAALLVKEGTHSAGKTVLVTVKGSCNVTLLLPILNSTGQQEIRTNHHNRRNSVIVMSEKSNEQNHDTNGIQAHLADVGVLTCIRYGLTAYN